MRPSSSHPGSQGFCGTGTHDSFDSMGAVQPSTLSVLSVLTKARLVELGRTLGTGIPLDTTKEQQIAALQRAAHAA